MARHDTALYRLRRIDPELARAALRDALVRNEGVLVRAALELGIDRRHLQRLLYMEEMWSLVDRLRAERRVRIAKERSAEHGWMAAAKAALMA